MRIALCGEPRSGKDTVGDCLEGFHRLAFGHYMKEAYFKKFPEKRYLPKDREDMIDFSQPLVSLYNRIWIDWVEHEMTFLEELDVKENFVVTDLRQPHEEKWCRENGFHIVRVHSSEIVRVERARNKGEHLGKDLPYWVQADFHIYNDGSLEDLKSQVDNLLDCLNDIEAKRRRL
ncbi:AAA family ATPase [Bacillus cereus]